MLSGLCVDVCCLAQVCLDLNGIEANAFPNLVVRDFSLGGELIDGTHAQAKKRGELVAGDFGG